RRTSDDRQWHIAAKARTSDGAGGTATSANTDEESTISDGFRVRAEGLEPSACGLRVRCSTIELCPQACRTSSVFSESGATRTPDLRVRSPALYPSELRTLMRCGLGR